ncbi:ABC transporter ATP-binding protein [Erwiniaceae bacterium BAC15a-03b]|uniref:ABC-type dipeptide transporter n=1 Tax=Winslowiella arboricola TaxID=2978220 RepID=A0A9J6PR44_9GAMM|nr:ABC transporter ATP-binding protein [Winslowiella arboricola]MCU5771072.1 ABC transporter ATP-binding protein [Winslowiella arboricola]MCU5778133.1 ABC transporter ATP-binding protein [Winslowiella arboricola]
MAKLLEFENFSASFGDQRAVRNLNLALQQGEFLALVGESGCGKSITALSAMRLAPENARLSGAIRYQGRDLLSAPAATVRGLRGNEISMIFQEPMTSLNPVLTIGQQLTETLRCHRAISGRAARQQAIDLLDRVNIPHAARRVDDYAHHFSGGQRQRIMIALAVACEPKLLIADEPTTALDVTVQQQILSLLDRLRHELKMGVLFITHDLGLVEQRADRVAVMYQGQKVEENSKTALFHQPKHAYSRGLLAASLHSMEAPHYLSQRLTEIVHQPEAAPRLITPPLRSFAPLNRLAPPLLQLEDVSFNYAADSGSAGVKNISLTLQPGETLGLVGESGCGKSTLSKLILRLLTPDSGKIWLDGHEIAQWRSAQLAPLRQRMQMVFQDPYASLNPRHTIEEILTTPLRVHRPESRASHAQSVRQVLDQVGLPQSALKRLPHAFSGGQRQRIGIARALIVDPALLICDEPVSALDVSVQAQILNLLVDLKHERQLSLLFISHDLAVVKYIADRVMVMYQGETVEQGDHQQIWHQPQHPYTRQLLQSLAGRREAAA